MTRTRLQVVLPVHNEAETIEGFLDELFEALAGLADAEVLVCEDGSRDGTKAALERAAARYPGRVRLDMWQERRGYTRAMVDGIARTDADHVLALDTDGQCDPSDVELLWARRDAADLVQGERRPRRDHLSRRAMSTAFGLAFRRLFHPSVGDPSCPFALFRGEAIRQLLPSVGVLPYGFWWEVVARGVHAGWSVESVPIHHRQRTAGETQAFPLRKLPLNAAVHLHGLYRLWRELRNQSATTVRSSS